MKTLILLTSLLCFINSQSEAMKLPGLRVYVVTPSSKPQIDEGRSAPFYYHSWMRRMDSSQNDTISTTAATPTTTTTTTQKANAPDLIFAEFESNHMKNIRKLLEREKISAKTTTTTSTPIYVPDETMKSQNLNYGLLSPMKDKNKIEPVTKDKTDYFALYNNLYDNSENLPGPVYEPSATPPATTTLRPTTIPTTTETSIVNNVENIWHIIDSEKHDHYVSQWDEVPIGSDDEHDSNQRMKTQDKETKKDKGPESDDSPTLDENFALPGFATNTGNDAENESRAIRTEPNIRFPYVNLKPFKIDKFKKPLLNVVSNSKKGNNIYTSLDNFFEIKNPVRGEVEDKGIMRQKQQPIDRYNPAQPYLPSPEYGSKSKQSSPNSPPIKTVANLVPPPPPPAPQLTADDFPAPVSYESFPPYPQAGSAQTPPKIMSRPQPPALTDDSDAPPPSASDDDDGQLMDLGYRYKPPSQPSQPFLPTVSPSKPSYGGYSYDKPSMTIDSPPAMDDKPDFQGYSYDKPDSVMPQKPFNGYQYSKPEPRPSPPMDHPPPSYVSHGRPSHDPDYPELIFDKPHRGMNGMKGEEDSMGMMPPPAPSKGMKPDFNVPDPPGDDNGFPHDFPTDFKFSDDFDHDHDHHLYHHHHTTTTTTTEMPRVNRYSYYYLGKKLYYLPLYFSVYFIVYVGALIIKAVLRHKIVYPNSFRPNDDTASFFAKRSLDSWDLSKENLHEITGKVTHAIAKAAEKYTSNKTTKKY